MYIINSKKVPNVFEQTDTKPVNYLVSNDDGHMGRAHRTITNSEAEALVALCEVGVNESCDPFSQQSNLEDSEVCTRTESDERGGGDSGVLGAMHVPYCSPCAPTINTYTQITTPSEIIVGTE